MDWIIRAEVLIFTIWAQMAAEAVAAVDFSGEVQPIFARHCHKCHGEDKQKGGLRLDSVVGVRKGGDSGEPLFIAGRGEESHLYQLVSSMDVDERMPPEGRDSLAERERRVIKAWIDEGAALPGGNVRQAVTTDHWSFQDVLKKKPPLGEGQWGNGAIDSFILAAMADKKLSPSPRAERQELIRRLYLVLHGLPPSPVEVDTFIKDSAPGAWEKLVERALSSPRFGERWARHWLDIVRFAESNGFETNRERLNAYHYRDYVINAFNEDRPYDRFIKEQIAGDAIGVDIATGFLVAGAFDVVKSQDINLTQMQRQDELADMVNTTGATFLGLTIGCARCHNHKFDPVTQKDYYSLQAVFAGVSHGDRVIGRPLTKDVEVRLQALRKAVASDEAQLEQFRKIAAAGTGKSAVLRPPVNIKLNIEAFEPVNVKFVRFTIHQSSNGSQPCIDELMVFSTNNVNVAPGAVPTSSGTLPGYPIHKLEHINDGKSGNSRSWISNKRGGGWVQLEFRKPTKISRIEWARDREGKFSDRLATDYVIEGSVDGSGWQPLAGSGSRRPFGGKVAPNAFLAGLQPADADRARDLISEVAGKKGQMVKLSKGYSAWVANFKQPGKTHRLYRGDPMARREVVAPDTLEVFGSLAMKLDEVEQQRRVKLAGWIANKNNPLTARVMVNRLWQFIFGVGIVDTPSDFGGNGTAPTHPELLDWMAAEFMDNGWSMKRMMRKMLTSATFRQSSRPRVAAARIDADSRYLWRFPPRRLEAEAIRDSILAVAGTLDLRMGGPGFYLFDVDRENVVHYHAKEETGPAEWRRMVYMFKIRQEQDSIFAAFDCPDGNQVIPSRSRSTTPLQALNLFNSRFIIEHAGQLAARLEREAGDDLTAQVNLAFNLFYNRPATPTEQRDAVDFIGAHSLSDFCRAMFNTNEFLFTF
ncbi:MAG: DUF1553 domain-containing protein [Verrucomicrobiaceae bacterium]|nr:DUF1553 domain-containing protein [Verrucomicrobiaceae bacterium]